VEGSRGDVVEVIVEALSNSIPEITLLTVVQNNNPTLFCAPMVTVKNDYQESWQPARISDKFVRSTRHGRKSNQTLGAGLLSRIFLADDVYFSELSPRP
jgi:phosphoribosylglycinamide formyltransferase 2